MAKSQFRKCCSYHDCSEPSIATITVRGYCLAHFIAICYSFLEEHTGEILGQGKEHTVRDIPITLEEIINEVTSLGLKAGNFTNHERGQLMDILLWACEALTETSTRGNGSRL
jgi:hypothetical protein